MDNNIYGYKFTSSVTEDSRRSAREIMPYLVERYHPNSMVDVGCCLGVWLAEAEACGVKRIIGIDGQFIDRARLMIDPEKFIAVDLENSVPALNEQFDMALCLEVAEHLNEAPAVAMLRWICDHARVIVWSAAIPGQAGVNHINERWASYWRIHFANAGFFPTFEIRDKFWDNDRIGMCIKQNILVYTKDADPYNPRAIDVIHPDLYGFKIFGWEALKNGRNV